MISPCLNDLQCRGSQPVLHFEGDILNFPGWYFLRSLIEFPVFSQTIFPSPCPSKYNCISRYLWSSDLCVLWIRYHQDVSGSPVVKTLCFHCRGYGFHPWFSSVQFSSVAQSCPTLCDPMNRSTPGLPVHDQLPEFTQTHIHWVSDAIQSSHPLSSHSSPAPNPSQHQSLFQWVNSSHQVAKILELQR